MRFVFHSTEHKHSQNILRDSEIQKISFFKKCIVFLFLCQVFPGVCRFSLAAASGVYSRVASRGLLVVAASLVQRGLSGTPAYQLWPLGMRDLPRQGIEPVSSVLQGRFLTTGPPGKPLENFFHKIGKQSKALDVFYLKQNSNDNK